MWGGGLISGREAGPGIELPCLDVELGGQGCRSRVAGGLLLLKSLTFHTHVASRDFWEARTERPGQQDHPRGRELGVCSSLAENVPVFPF